MKKDAPLADLEAKLGYRFKNRELLETALTHKSALVGRDHRDDATYQRLEFLGDRVLAITIADMLYENFPGADEGELARRLTGLVRNETCADVASDLLLGLHIRMGEGEIQAGGRKKAAILGDVCEAVIAAIFKDGGIVEAGDFIKRNWSERMMSWSKPLRDPKTTLQEWAHKKSLNTPSYRELSREGPDHALSFVVEVTVDGLEAEKGQGKSKRDAQQKAASAMLVREGVWDEDTYE